MSDLRFACIEAMAPVLHDFDDGRFCSDQCLVAAGSALDALLGVLEEHAVLVWWCDYEMAGWGDAEPYCNALHDGYVSDCGWRRFADLAVLREGE